MFSNLFMYFGPTWSALALFAVVVLPFCFALAETLRLAQPASRRPCLAMIQLDRFRQRLVHSLAVAQAGSVREARRALPRMFAVAGRGRRR